MINGVAVFSRNLAAGLQKRGHEVLVLAPSITGEFSIDTDKEFGFKIARLSSRKIFLYPDQINEIPEAKEFLGLKIPHFAYKNGLHVSLKPYPEIKAVLDMFKPDVIHDQTPGPVALAVFRYAKKNDIPLVSTDHAYPDNLTQQVHLPRLLKEPIAKVMNRYFISFLKRSQYATMPTEQAVSDLIPKNRKHFKVPVEALSNGIDFSRFSKAKASDAIYEKYGIPKSKPILLYVGRVDPEKSLDVLLRGYEGALKKCPELHLVVVGDGTSKTRLERYAETNGLTHAHFLGRIVGDDLPEIYRTGTLFGISSKTETQSIVVMEAMASGLPVVGVRAGALPELIKNNKNGYLCKPDDEAAMARYIAKIATDKKLRNKLAGGSKEIIKKHDINYTLSRMEEIYETVLKNHIKK